MIFAATAAEAQTANTGAVTGRVTDAASGQPVAGVTVVAQGPQGEQAELTDSEGSYTITGLTPGKYVVRFYFANVKVERQNVEVFADKKIQVNVPLQTKAATAETYTITEKAPTIDIGSTKIGTTINKDFTQNVPVGRNFDTVAEVAPGAQIDEMGVSFGGATSAENNYVIDGVNVTSVHMSQAAGSSLGSALNLDFIQEVEIITGGYNAEYGRSTGGVVNVITKSGSNEFHGDAAFYYDPGPLRGTAPRVSFPGSSLSTQPEHAADDYRLDFFADLGGPIIKDRLWFYVGFEPVFARATTRRIVSKLIDNCDQRIVVGMDTPGDTYSQPCTGNRVGMSDGFQDFTNGDYATQELYHTLVTGTAQQYQWTGKINLLVTPDHTLQVAYYGAPTVGEGFRVNGAPGLPFRDLSGSQDLAGHWVSKLFDKKWQIEASMTYHREIEEHQLVDPLESSAAISWGTDPALNTNAINGRQGSSASLSWFSQFEPFGDIVNQNCDVPALNDPVNGRPPTIHPVDPNSKLKITCPVPNYTTGGGGGWENLLAQRFGARVAGTNFFRALGHHSLMYGWDPEVNQFQDTRLVTGGGYLQPIQIGNSKYVYSQGWGYYIDKSVGPSISNVVLYPFKRNSMTGKPEVDAMGLPVRDYTQCHLLDGQPDQGIPPDASLFCADTQTVNHAVFIRDQWSVLPNLTLNLGLRWERQSIQGVTDFENSIIGDAPIELNNNWAPRVGVIYDPTNEGKAKIYGSFARFYESIPLDINNRSFGQEGFSQYYYGFRDVRRPLNPPPNYVPQDKCIENLVQLQPNTAVEFHCPLVQPSLFGGAKSLIEPDLSGMYTDEIVIGGEYEIIEDLALGAYYTHKNLGTIIEDGSVNNAATYYIVNPGEKVSNSQVQTLLNRSMQSRAEAVRQMQAGNMVLANDYNSFASELANFADDLPYFANFDKPTRDYNALTMTAKKRFSKNWLAQASYTYARTIGNYPGIYNPYINQRDPNISQMYDLPDLLVNRDGPLPIDIPHQLKLDGYYSFRIKGDNQLVTGGSFRAQSGSPRGTFGVNDIYTGTSEVFLLPTGQNGRNDFFTSLDIQLSYVRQLKRNMQVQLFFAAYNVFNQSTATSREDVYTGNFVTPIVNGNRSDLNHLKTIDGSVAKPNAAFDRPTSYQRPIITRFGARFTF